MALSSSNVGKQCVYNKSDDQNITDSVLPTIIGYYSNGTDTYYTLSLNNSGQCVKLMDDTKIDII